MVGNVHVVVGVLGIASASEFDKGVTGSREWFVERSSFGGIGLGEGGLERARKTMGYWNGETKPVGSPSSSAPDRKIERADHS